MDYGQQDLRDQEQDSQHLKRDPDPAPGDECLYTREKTTKTIDDSLVESRKLDENEDAEHDDFSREILGAFVQFGDGGSVSKFTLPGEISKVCIRGFPLSSTPTSVSSLFNEFGFDKVEPNCVELNRPFQATKMDAYITVEDPTFPKAVYNLLKFQTHANEGLRIIRTSRPTIITKSISRNITSKKVYLSWVRPTRTAELSFENKDVADRVYGKFRRSVYKILDQPVSVDEPKYSRKLSNGNRRAWTVVLTDVPVDATQNDIQRSLRSKHDSARHIVFAKINRACDPNDTPSTVASVLKKFGLVGYRLKASHQSHRFEAIAHFNSETGANKAVQTLPDTRLECLNGGKLTMRLVSLAKFKVPTTVYDALKSQLAFQGYIWKEQNIKYNVDRNTDSKRRFTSLTLEGTGPVSTAADIFEKILAGRTLNDGDHPLWIPAFAGNGEAYHVLKQVQKMNNVAIIRDRMKRQLIYFGPPKKYRHVLKDIMRLVKSEPITTHIVHLNSDELSWVLNGGVEHLTAVLGQGVVSLEVAPDLASLFITGSMNYHVAVAIMQGKVDDTFQGGTSCTVCWTEAEYPIVTKCYHTYCTECFENLCVSTKSASGPFSICCQGDMGKCARVFSLCELQDYLASSKFEDILEASVASYVSRRPRSFRYCPTPHCGYVYHVTDPSNPNVHTCLNCNQTVCTACHGLHNAVLTCAEYKAFMSDADAVFEKYKSESSFIKDCPVCGTSIEKDGGCNHVECGNCWMHICWKCLDSFEDDYSCYTHMRRAGHF